MAETVYTVAPIPPDPEHTTYVDAGSVSFGIEYRLLDDAQLAANYQGADMDEIRGALQDKQVQEVEDNGISIHVIAKVDGHEYLRFDCFENGPHYHYIEPSGEKQTIVDYDEGALGDMVEWTIDQLRTRLAEMLERAGGATIAASLESARIEIGLTELAGLIDESRTRLAAERRRS
ncbi:MAG: hypothetical protein E4H03_07660 [Myxococcales bacterium]|jgi:hypothetical protein|nr:MAG: hypothetical protein E4H03_07660 [Myxococcales bacterium]